MKRLCLAWIVAVLWVSVAWAGGKDAYKNVPEPYRDRFIEAWQKAGRAEVERADWLKDQASRQKNRAARKRMLDGAKECRLRVAQLKKNDPPYLPTVSLSKNGSVGRLHPPVKVVEVIDDDEAVVTTTAFNPRGGAIVEVWIKGVDTAEWGDGDSPDILLTVFQVTGEEEGKTELEVFDTSAWFPKADAKEPQKPVPPPE